MADDEVSATIHLSVYIMPENNFPTITEDSHCVSLLTADLAPSSSSCKLIASRYTLSRGEDDTLLVAPI